MNRQAIYLKGRDKKNVLNGQAWFRYQDKKTHEE